MTALICALCGIIIGAVFVFIQNIKLIDESNAARPAKIMGFVSLFVFGIFAGILLGGILFLH